MQYYFFMPVQLLGFLHFIYNYVGYFYATTTILPFMHAILVSVTFSKGMQYFTAVDYILRYFPTTLGLRLKIPLLFTKDSRAV